MAVGVFDLYCFWSLQGQVAHCNGVVGLVLQEHTQKKLLFKNVLYEHISTLFLLDLVIK